MYNMAKRICFVPRPNKQPIFEEIEIDFQYYNGFSYTQKEKSITSLHQSIHDYDKNLKILEISTKSQNEIGVALSAFNLEVYDEKSKRMIPLENIFQSSKVFKNDGPFRDLIEVKPYEAKRDTRLKNSGELIGFSYNGKLWELEPKTMFYDWLYIHALASNKFLAKQVMEYNAFTDMEFNHKKSINCQARSVAIFVGLHLSNKLPLVLDNCIKFREICYSDDSGKNQLSFFD